MCCRPSLGRYGSINLPPPQHGEQLSLFAEEPWPEHLYNGNPLKVITLCSGYDAQCLAFDQLKEEFSEFDYDLVAWSEFDPESRRPLKDQPAVIAHNALFPQWKDRNMGDMTNPDYSNIPDAKDIDILIYSTPCFVAGTLVMTDSGLKPIENIKTADKVLTHTNRFQPVRMCGRKRFNGYLYELRGMCFYKILCTPEHPFYIRRRHYCEQKRKRMFGKPEWVQASLLDKDCYLGMAINQNSELPKWNGSEDNRWGHHRIVNKLSLLLDNGDFWYIMGRYVGDGWRRDDLLHKCILIACSERNEQSLCDALNRIGWNYALTKQRTCNRVQINSRELCDFVKRYGYKAHGKRIDAETMNLPVELLKRFLDGYVASDGTYDKSKNVWKCNTVSRLLAAGIVQCVAKVYHTACKVYYIKTEDTTVIEGRTVNQRDYYSLAWKTGVKTMDRAFYEDGYVWFPLRSIKVVDNERTEVYNLEVTEDNSYTANGVIVHNCQSVSNAGKREGIAEGSGTRSAILWYTTEFIKKFTPHFLLQENVAALVNQSNKYWFDEWRKRLEGLGYTSEWKILNATDFGVPQNRERVFMLSWRNDLHLPEHFDWPKPIPLNRVIADVLQEEVDSKYFLKPQSVESFLTKNEQKDQHFIYCTVDHKPNHVEVEDIICRYETGV